MGYFTEENLCRDSYLRSFLDIDGYVPLSVIFRFPSVSRYQAAYEDILWMIQALNKEADIDPERSSSKTNVMIPEVTSIENEKSSSTNPDENRSETKESSNSDDIKFQGENGGLLIELDVERELLRLKNGNFSMYLMKQNDGTMGRPQWDINEYYNSKNTYFHQNEINFVRKRSLHYFLEMSGKIVEIFLWIIHRWVLCGTRIIRPIEAHCHLVTIRHQGEHSIFTLTIIKISIFLQIIHTMVLEDIVTPQTEAIHYQII